LVRRFYPVTIVAAGHQTTVVRDRATVHCVMHLLDQFEGRVPCGDDDG
jgi:hypothetical protein